MAVFPSPLIAYSRGRIARLQCGQRVIRRARSRSRKKRDIHRVLRNAPRVARGYKDRAVHDVAARIIRDVPRDRAARPGIEIGGLPPKVKFNKFCFNLFNNLFYRSIFRIFEQNNSLPLVF